MADDRGASRPRGASRELTASPECRDEGRGGGREAGGESRPRRPSSLGRQNDETRKMLLPRATFVAAQRGAFRVSPASSPLTVTALRAAGQRLPHGASPSPGGVSTAVYEPLRPPKIPPARHRGATPTPRRQAPPWPEDRPTRRSALAGSRYSRLHPLAAESRSPDQPRCCPWRSARARSQVASAAPNLAPGGAASHAQRGK